MESNEAPRGEVVRGGSPSGGVTLPAIITTAGEKASRRFVEFFTAEIRNPNTRAAYAQAVRRFLEWCEAHDLALERIEPVPVAAYVEELGTKCSVATVKQHLAAIRMLFDYLVRGGVLPVNPAAAVRGPRHVVAKGKTPVLFADDARRLIEAIDVSHVVGLRDRALVGVMVYSFARVGAAVKMRVRDYYSQGRRAWLVLHEKGGRYLKVPAHHKAAWYLDAHIEAAGIGLDRDGPLFRSAKGRRRELGQRAMSVRDVARMVKRRARDAGLPPEISCHSFRAAGITDYLSNGGTLEVAAQIAGHASTKTTQLYDRRVEEISLDEIERVRI